MKFFVFSYNRGEYLANCVRSIEECAPGAAVTVYDDRSDDPHTRAVLDDVARRHTVVVCEPESGHKHGGLYANMQAALDSLAEDTIVCFMQDDTQLVRRLDSEDYEFIESGFARKPDLGFMSPAFIRGISLSGKRPLTFDYDGDLNLFFPRPGGRRAGVYYSDIFLASTRRLRERSWRFDRGEPANQLRASSSFAPMGYMACPFLMWLPNGTAYRGKQKTLALRIAERARGCGFYPFEYLQPADVAQLRLRPPPELPVAERYLRTLHGDPRKPWIYDPMQGSNALKHLNRAELLLRRVF